MDWQTLGVAVVVGAALFYLVRRFVLPSRRRQRPAQTFIPLSNVKRRDDSCH
jgi:uncharacterized membrane-anchored protein YhcB (DUF1043 family)